MGWFDSIPSLPLFFGNQTKPSSEPAPPEVEKTAAAVPEVKLSPSPEKAGGCYTSKRSKKSKKKGGKGKKRSYKKKKVYRQGG